MDGHFREVDGDAFTGDDGIVYFAICDEVASTLNYHHVCIAQNRGVLIYDYLEFIVRVVLLIKKGACVIRMIMLCCHHKVII